MGKLGVSGVRVGGGLCRVQGQAGRLRVLGLEGAGGAFQLWAELGSLVHLSLLLPLQLPLPLTELMENEALEILTKALQSEPPHFPSPQLPQETLGDLPGLRPVGVGFQDVSALSDSLTTHKYSRSPMKSKKLGDWAQGDPTGTAWGDRQGPGL